MWQAKKYDSIKELDGLSEKTMTEHYKLYEGYVKKANEIEEKLSGVDLTLSNQIFSELRALKTEYSFALGGIKNHELYFSLLGGDRALPSGKLLEKIEQDFGSYDNWTADFKATGMAARGWVFLVYDRDSQKLFNHLGDSQNTYAVWNADVLMAMDVYEHAYFIDYGVKRADYIEAFLKNLDWQKVILRKN